MTESGREGERLAGAAVAVALAGIGVSIATLLWTHRPLAIAAAAAFAAPLVLGLGIRVAQRLVFAVTGRRPRWWVESTSPDAPPHRAWWHLVLHWRERRTMVEPPPAEPGLSAWSQGLRASRRSRNSGAGERPA